jgi:D-alanyl-lipoteichoic acid acyltransferase DltB (MBOAT superfamily)
VNLMLVMLLGGMWHGAAWRFGLWGAWHGGLLALERATGWAERVERSRGLRIAGIIVTFHLVCLGWVFFRADSLQTGVDLLRHIITSPVIAELSGALQVHAIAAALIAFMLVLHATPPAWRNVGAVVMQRGTPLLQAAVLVALVWAAATVQISSAQPFIYFQF